MHTRREFLRRIGLLAAAGVAADQLDLLERLAPRQKYFTGTDFAKGPDHTAVMTVSIDAHGNATMEWAAGRNVRSVDFAIEDTRGQVRQYASLPAGVEGVRPLHLDFGEQLYVSLRCDGGQVVHGRARRYAPRELSALL